ncbi:MAG: glycosyltransferase family 39 protein, partial [Anaerolineae bacterium]|nr:glycosyltransferase family 39 protein [Anaerolineae bacterium]
MGVPVHSSDARRHDLRALGCAVWAYATEPANLALWGVVLLAALTRLTCLDLIEFKGDEVGHLLRALRILEERRLPAVGSQASVGIAKPPMMSLLMAVPLLFGRDPRLASGFIALLNVAAIGGCFLLARRYYNLRVALIAAALFAANPWAIVFSRKVFTADVLAPFLVLCLYALHAAIIDRAAWGWLVAVLSLGIMLLITFSPLPLALLLVVCILGWRREVRWGHLLTGAGLALLLFVPYLHAQLAQLQGMKALVQTVMRGGSAAAPGPGALQVAAWLHSGRHLGALAGAAFTSFAPAHSPLRALDGLAALLFGLAVPGVIAMAAEAWLRAERRAHLARYTLLALWLAIPLVVVSSGIVRVETQYLIILYPAGFVAMALVVDRAWTALAGREGRHRSRARIARCGLGAVLGAVVIWQVYCVFYLFSFVAAHDTAGGYGVPLRSWLAITTMVRREAAATGVDDVWAIVEGTDVSCEQTPAILSYLLGPELEVTFLGQGGHEALLLPAGRPALYLVARQVPAPVEAMLGRLGAQERAALPASGGSVAARVLL